MTRVFYSDDGSTAVEVALKMAIQYWQQRTPLSGPKHLFVNLTGAYHGDTAGAMSVGNIELFHARFRPLLFRSIKVETLKTRTSVSRRIVSVESVERLFKQRHRAARDRQAGGRVPTDPEIVLQRDGHGQSGSPGDVSRGLRRRGRPARPIIALRVGAPCRTRTCDLLVRSQTLYPTELRALRGAASTRPLSGRRAVHETTILPDGFRRCNRAAAVRPN